MFSRKTLLVLYLAVWTTLAARLTFEFVYIVVPKRGDFGQVGTAVPFVAFPAALGLAFLLLRRHDVRVSSRLSCYLWLAPLLLYFVILFFTAAAAASVVPASSVLVLIFGFSLGLPVLVMGIPIHAIGLLPLAFWDDRFFAPPTADKDPIDSSQ